MKHKFISSVVVFAMGVIFLTVPPLHAQDNAALMAELINRVGEIESDNRELRGQLEEARHEISQLTQRMETLSADVDYRLNNAEGGSALSSSVVIPPSAEGKETPSRAPSNASEEYEKARALLEQGDYGAAESAFAAFVSAHPQDEYAGAAQYWLGVTFFVRGEHEKAAAAFAKGYKAYPKSSKASDGLLKLAKSLAELDRASDACATLEQLASEYPKAHVKEVAREQQKLKCK